MHKRFINFILCYTVNDISAVKPDIYLPRSIFSNARKLLLKFVYNSI